jgi:pimeloyl-ACP methyl ester carboxylesterase
MPRSAPVDGFSLAYDRAGSGVPAVLLHGWPGHRGDYRDVVPLLAQHADVIVPDLRGFGESDRRERPPREAYSAEAQATSVLGLIEELALEPPVLFGYDVGSRIARTLVTTRPEAIRALVLAPPMPGAGERILRSDEFWYQPFHRLALSEQLLDGNEAAVRTYLRHFWDHWSAPGWSLADDRFEEIVALYSRPGAFTSSIAWYRSGSGGVQTALRERAPAPADRIAVRTTVLWPEHERLFPLEWADRLGEFFSDFELQPLPGVGHFSPLEAPERVAEATARAARR